MEHIGPTVTELREIAAGWHAHADRFTAEIEELQAKRDSARRIAVGFDTLANLEEKED